MPARRCAAGERRGRSTPGRHWRARSDGRPDCRCRPRRRIADRAAADRACRTSCRNGRGSAASLLIVASVASSRSTASSVPDPAEVARADRRQEIEAEIGRRGPMRDDRLRVLLEVVRRQHVVRRRDEGLEEAPGAPRDQAQRAGVGSARPARVPATAASGSIQRAIAGEAIQSSSERQRERPGPVAAAAKRRAPQRRPMTTPPAIRR